MNNPKRKIRDTKGVSFYNRKPNKYLGLVLLPFLALLSTGAFQDNGQKCSQDSCRVVPSKSQEIRFQKFLADFPDLLDHQGKEVLIVVPTSGCPRGIEWAIDFYQKNEDLNHDRVKNMIVSENPFIYAQSPLPDLLSPDFQGNLAKLNSLGFYPNAPQIAFLEGGKCEKFIGVNCRPDSELATEIKDFLGLDSSVPPGHLMAGR